MPFFKKKWKITFAEPIGKFGNKFELEDWIDLHKRISSVYAANEDKRYVILESKVIRAIREATESRPDYKLVAQESQITDKNGKPVPSEQCVFMVLKGEEANLQLLLKYIKEESGDYYEVLAVGDKKIADFICNSVLQRVRHQGEFVCPMDVLLDWLGRWTTDAFTGKATGLLIHAGLPPTSEPIVYLAVSPYEVVK